MSHLFKTRLQNYAQKRNMAFPTYTCEMQGPPHSRLFKAHVTLDGNTYVGPEFCTTLKDAEHAAAKVAFMSLSPEGEQQDDCLYKSLLQELAQKKGLLLPIYTTDRTGPPHVPCFSSSVQIADDHYVGETARTKKQAEMNAAKVAYLALSKGGPRTNNAAAVSNIQTVGASSSGSPILQTAVTHIDEPIIIPPASEIQTTINDQALSIANEAEKGKGYQDLKTFQDIIEKHKNTMALPVIHQSQPKDTPEVADFAKLSIRQEDVATHTTKGSGAREKINQLPSAAGGKINQLSSTANEMINQLSSATSERITQLSPTANEKINKLSPTEVTFDPVVGSDALRTRSIKIVIRPHIKGMRYDGPIQVSDEDWVAMKVDVYEET
uniref:double-stranded RNA-binding protein 1-like n=1 Tax=Erigeron canadensis TaxID=72917 RepID=UPI001CB9AF8D|nr:double-stranded RNA-binding protein 1-like [Erigeron canadensis]